MALRKRKLIQLIALAGLMAVAMQIVLTEIRGKPRHAHRSRRAATQPFDLRAGETKYVHPDVGIGPPGAVHPPLGVGPPGVAVDEQPTPVHSADEVDEDPRVHCKTHTIARARTKDDPWKALRVPGNQYNKLIGPLREKAAGYVQKLTPEMAPIRTDEERKRLCDHLKTDPNGVYSLRKTLQGAKGEYNCTLCIVGNLCRPPPEALFNTPRAKPGKKPRILCWILSSAKDTRKDAVRDTWARRCDLTIFAAGQDSDYPTLGLFVPDDRMHIASKAVAMWIYIYLHFLDQFDFFYKADPDTYAIVDNLRDYLKDKDPEQPLYLGNQFHIGNIPWWRYAAGGPGEVLSRTAVRVLVEHSYRKHCASCIPDGKCEDCKLARCLSMGGINITDSRDEHGRERFLPLNPVNHLFPEPGGGFYGQYNLFRPKGGHDCCSDHPISFHYIKTYQMYLLEYFFYRWKVVDHDPEDYNQYKPLPQMNVPNFS